MKNIIILFICATFTGCGPTYYAPNTQNVPIMENQGQTNLSIGLNSSQFTEGVELQGAYGLTDNLALQLNTDWVKSSEGFSNGSGNFVELGAGYYKNVSKHFIFETYGLLGLGSLKYKETEEIKANFVRYGLQPSFSFNSNYFSASLSGRLVNLNYTSVSGTHNDVAYLKANNSYWIIEPAITLQGGFEDFKLMLQFQISENLTDHNFSQEYVLISLALKFNINPEKN